MNAVFTSCGDRTSCDKIWCGDDRNYDIVAAYYGDDKDIFSTYCDAFDVVFKHKGSKFQNFFTFYRNSNVFKRYERVFILDDDIVMNTDDINEMFRFSQRYNLDICQPCFDKKSKISHTITKQDTSCDEFKYTDFVEVNTPLMTMQAISNLNTVYNHALIGWGVDFLYTWVNNNKSIPKSDCKKFAINHRISCTNPKDREREGKEGRELNKISGAKHRSQTWTGYSKHVGCPVHWTPSNLDDK